MFVDVVYYHVYLFEIQRYHLLIFFKGWFVICYFDGLLEKTEKASNIIFYDTVDTRYSVRSSSSPGLVIRSVYGSHS